MARTPRLTERFLAQRQALRIRSDSAESRAIARAIASLCTAETLPEPDHRALLQPEANDDRGVAMLVDVRTFVVTEGRESGRRFWLCYRSDGPFLRVEAIYNRAPPYET